MAKRTALLGMYGLDPHDEVWIRTVVSVALPRLRHHWRLTDATRAQVLICNPNSLQRQEQQFADTLRVSLLRHNEDPLPGTLTLHAPIRTDPFLKLLDHCGEQLNGTPALMANPDDTAAATDRASDHRFALPPMLAWVEQIHACLAAGYDAEIRIAGRPTYTIRQRQRRLACLGGEISPHYAQYLVTEWLKMSDQDFASWEVLRRRPQDRATGADGPSDPLLWWPVEMLLWNFAVRMGEQGRLAEPAEQLCYRLSRWPDFGVIGRISDDLMLATALVRHTLTMAQLQSFSGASRDATVRMLQACLCCGWLQQKRPAVTDELVVTSQRTDKRGKRVEGGLLNMIRDAMKLGRKR